MKWIMIFLTSVQLRWREGDDDNLPNQSKVFENFADFNSICHFENQSKKFRMASIPNFPTQIGGIKLCDFFSVD